jgi:hypothetical protein
MHDILTYSSIFLSLGGALASAFVALWVYRKNLRMGRSIKSKEGNLEASKSEEEYSVGPNAKDEDQEGSEP